MHLRDVRVHEGVYGQLQVSVAVWITQEGGSQKPTVYMRQQISRTTSSQEDATGGKMLQREIARYLHREREGPALNERRRVILVLYAARKRGASWLKINPGAG